MCKLYFKFDPILFDNNMLAANHVDHFFFPRKFPNDNNNNERNSQQMNTFAPHISSHFSNGYLPTTCVDNSCTIQARIYHNTQQIIIQLNVSVLLYQRKCKFQGSKKLPVSSVRVICYTRVFEQKPINGSERISFWKIALGLEFDDPLANIIYFLKE